MPDKPRRTRRYDDGVCEIIIEDFTGHHYYFIFKPGRMMQVFDVANEWAMSEEFGFDRADAITVASDLELCLMMKGGAS